MHDKSERNEFCDCMIFFVFPEVIDDTCFAYFLKNKISLLELAHMPLNNKQLEKLSELYDETSMPLTKWLCLETYSIREFHSF